MTEPHIDIEFTADEAEILRGLHASMADNIRAQILAEMGRIEKAERRLMRQPSLDFATKSRYRERADALMGAIGVVEKLSLTLD